MPTDLPDCLQKSIPRRLVPFAPVVHKQVTAPPLGALRAGSPGAPDLPVDHTVDHRELRALREDHSRTKTWTEVPGGQEVQDELTHVKHLQRVSPTEYQPVLLSSGHIANVLGRLWFRVRVRLSGAAQLQCTALGTRCWSGSSRSSRTGSGSRARRRMRPRLAFFSTSVGEEPRFCWICRGLRNKWAASVH